jgi:hypothetical protein
MTLAALRGLAGCSPMSQGAGFSRGNLEFLVAAQVTGIVEGPGKLSPVARCCLRYNFVQPGSALVPYFPTRGRWGLQRHA